MFTCKICGSEVTRGQAYCSHCGADVVSNYEVVCPACGTLNGAGNRFCAHCGALLGVLRKPVCSICGAENLPGVKFCVVCGAPVVDFESPLTEQDVLEMRKNKMNVDLMIKERMRVADREIEQMKRKVGEDKARALKEIEDYRKKTNDEFTKQAKLLDAYREKVNELGSEDVARIGKLAASLRSQARFYNDPYSALDEVSEGEGVFVCPICGTVNAPDAVKCVRCGRSKARSKLLLAKGKIKQSPPVRKKTRMIAAAEEDLSVAGTPTFDEFAGEAFEEAQNQPIEVASDAPAVADYTGGQARVAQGGYPYPPAGYGVPYYGADGISRQMPPIVQPVAFVPYVTQDQPLMQYTPTGEYIDEDGDRK